ASCAVSEVEDSNCAETAASAMAAADSAIASVARSVMTVSRIRCQLSQAAEDSDPAGDSGSDVLALTTLVWAKDSEAEAAAANAAPESDSCAGCAELSNSGSGSGVQLCVGWGSSWYA